ncbi:glycosyltransferase family 2 protein [Demequina sp. NBRC 110053]|uniref:glycosyltransferase n=1 Tax=Demequina sp. NBRC 110053 TaxID=1570342 RepID=UPI00135639A6|nr:glycosyltransferase [Demequina sp. NBRC 110053]
MSTERPPRISVIIPAYNAEATLGEQLDAMLRQDCGEPFEVVVSDNGSTDGTAALVNRYGGSLPHLRRVDSSARRGPGAARNVGAAAASGDLLLFCDADDVAADSWVRLMTDALSAHEFVGGGWELQSLNPGHHLAHIEPPVLTYVSFMPELPAHGGGNLGIRRHLFERVQGFDESLRVGEDIDLCWRVQLAGATLEPAGHAIVSVRVRSGVAAAWRQGWLYGRGERELRRRYASTARQLAQDDGVGRKARVRRVRVRASAVASRSRYIVRSLVHPRERVSGIMAIAESLGRRWGA